MKYKLEAEIEEVLNIIFQKFPQLLRYLFRWEIILQSGPGPPVSQVNFPSCADPQQGRDGMRPAANRGEKGKKKKKKKLGEPAGIMELVFKITKRDKVRISKRCVLINPISKGRGKRRCVVFQVARPLSATWPLALVDFHLTDFPSPVKISMGLVTNMPGELLLLRVSGVANSGELSVEWCRKIVLFTAT